MNKYTIFEEITQMTNSNSTTTRFPSIEAAVYLNPKLNKRWFDIQQCPRFNEEMFLKNWHVVDFLLDQDDLPTIAELRPELFAVEPTGDHFEVKTTNVRIGPILEKINAFSPLPMDIYKSLKSDIPEMTDKLCYIAAYYDVSGSMAEYSEMYAIMDKMFRGAILKSEAHTKRDKNRTVIKLARHYFNHEQTISQLPVDIADYEFLTEPPVVSGCTDLKTTLAVMLRNRDLMVEIKNVTRVDNAHVGQIIFSDGTHDMVNAVKAGLSDSPITMEELQLLYRNSASTYIGAISCCEKATEFYEEVGFQRGKNLLFVKRNQDREAFKRQLRKAVDMMSNAASAQISTSY
jgi:hypothetical protein